MGIELHSTGTDAVALVEMRAGGTILTGIIRAINAGVATGVETLMRFGMLCRGANYGDADLQTNDTTHSAGQSRAALQSVRGALRAVPITNLPAATRRVSASVKQGS